jgi:DNA-binding transcriptional ArsR family regulator
VAGGAFGVVLSAGSCGANARGCACELHPPCIEPTSAATLNHMVQYPQIDRAFAALADPTRRGVLERLGRGNATISELAEPFGISLTGMKKHVRVLEDAELVSTEKVGRARQCSLGPRRLDDVQQWIEMYRRMLEERLDRFGELLERTKGTTQ